MQVIHFTEAAADPLQVFQARETRLVNLANADGPCQVSCLHLAPGAQVLEPPVTHASTLLLVYGQMLITQIDIGLPLTLTTGVGVTLAVGERYTLESKTGAIIVIVEAPHLKPTEAGISRPGRLFGAFWPGEESPSRRKLAPPPSKAH